MSKKLRTFIALPLPDAVKQGLATVANDARNQMESDGVRWVAPERMHLTLAFLGDTLPEQVAEVRRGLDGVARGHRPVTLTLTHFGCFPNCRRPRVLWVGVEDHEDATARLRKALADMLAPLGWELDDRPFRAHLTLGRVRRGARIRLDEEKITVDPLTFTIDALHFYQSDLRPDGPHYALLHHTALNS